MTCFWDGIMSQLSKEDFSILQSSDGICMHGKCSVKELVILLQSKNILTNDVLWGVMNNQLAVISPKELGEHYNAVTDYNPLHVNNGHLTSTCDYFLLLLTQLLNIRIEHNYLKTIIIYTVDNPRKTWKFSSNRRHFSVL